MFYYAAISDFMEIVSFKNYKVNSSSFVFYVENKFF